MALSTYWEGWFPDFAEAKVESISPVRLYYVYAGRNAWHSTWITTYSEGCMHVSFKSAADFVEKKRVQGSVFNIREMPGIAFRSSAGDIVVTQINTTEPLSLYSAKEYYQLSHIAARNKDLTLDSYIRLGAPIYDVAKSFSWWSKFWRSQPPVSNSVIILATRDSSADYSSDIQGDFKAYVSYSKGSKYRLGWQNMSATISAEPIKRILSHGGHL